MKKFFVNKISLLLHIFTLLTAVMVAFLSYHQKSQNLDREFFSKHIRILQEVNLHVTKAFQMQSKDNNSFRYAKDSTSKHIYLAKKKLKKMDSLRFSRAGQKDKFKEKITAVSNVLSRIESTIESKPDKPGNLSTNQNVSLFSLFLEFEKQEAELATYLDNKNKQIRQSAKNSNASILGLIGLLLILIVLELYKHYNPGGSTKHFFRSGRLNENEALFKSFFKYNSAPMLLIDPQTGEIIDCNLAAAEFYGYSKETLSSLNINKVNTQPEVKVHLKMENAVKNDKNHFFFTHQLADGSYKDVEVYSSPLKINNRQVLFSIVHDITERRIAEQALKTSEKYYRGLFENAHDAVIIMSPEDETILDANQRACEIYGFKQEEFIGMSMKSISKDIPTGELRIQKTLDQGIYNNFETIHYNNNGEELFIEINASVVDYKGKKAILSLNRNVTERKNAEEYIKNLNANLEKKVEERTAQLDKINNDLVSEIEERKKLEKQIIKDKEVWRRSFISISEGIYLIDRDYNILECNKAFGEIVGDAPENLIGKKAYTIIHGEKSPPPHCISCSAIDKKRTVKGEFWEPHLRKYVYTTSDPVISEGEIDFSINTLRDITEEKKYEKALKKSEEKFRTYIENAPIGIFLANERGKFLDANPEGLQLLNYTMDELLSYSIPDIVSKDEQDNVTHSFQSLQDNGNSFHETKLLTNKGESFDVFVNAVKLDEDRYLAFVLDISDRKKAEENIYKSLEREKELSEMKTRFISMVSHEFRTPLANIYSNAQLLDRFEEKWNKEKKARSLDRILNSVKVLNSMLDDVSLFGKKQSGKLKFTPTPVDFDSYIRSLIDETLTNFNTKRHVRFEKDDNVGTIHTDKFLLHHIVTNLLSNALKYSFKETEVLLKIDKSDKEWINLTIQDHGKGIPEKELNKIFEPFYRASNIDNVSGTGLGMAIIKHCTDLLSGTLHIDSEIGIGTTVSINIPVSAKKPKANVHEA